MTTFQQNASAFMQEWGGKIPVWDQKGNQVGYRTSYDSYAIIFTGPYTAGQPLVTKNFYMMDEIISVPASPIPTTQTAAAQTVIASTSAAVPATVAVTGTAIQGTGNALLDTFNKYKLPIIIAGGSVALLWLFFGRGR